MPCRLLLDADAYSVFQRYRAWHEPQLRRGGELGDIADWGSKLPGAILRIAGLLHIATHERPEDHRIAAAIIERAVSIGRYFTEHAKVMYRVIAGRSGQSDARQVLDALRKLNENDSPVPRWKLHRALRGRKSFERAAELNAPLALLEEFGWIHRSRESTAGRDKELITLNPYEPMVITPERYPKPQTRCLVVLLPCFPRERERISRRIFRRPNHSSQPAPMAAEPVRGRFFL